jgi:hypothetical protein
MVSSLIEVVRATVKLPGVVSILGNSRPYFFGCRNSQAAAITAGT